MAARSVTESLRPCTRKSGRAGMISWAASCHLARCSGTPICRTLGVQQVETHRYALASTLWGARRAWSRGRQSLHVCTAHGRCADACTRMLGLQSQEAWYTFVEDDPVSASATTSTSISSTTHVPDLWQMKIRGLRSLRLPALPSIYYSSEWQGYEDTVARVVSVSSVLPAPFCNCNVAVVRIGLRCPTRLCISHGSGPPKTGRDRDDTVRFCATRPRLLEMSRKITHHRIAPIPFRAARQGPKGPQSSGPSPPSHSGSG